MGYLGMTHGACQCRECYVKNGHPECPECKGLTLPEWKFCSHCGAKLKAAVV